MSGPIRGGRLVDNITLKSKLRITEQVIQRKIEVLPSLYISSGE
jgi:hypothetical protein